MTNHVPGGFCQRSEGQTGVCATELPPAGTVLLCTVVSVSGETSSDGTHDQLGTVVVTIGIQSSGRCQALHTSPSTTRVDTAVSTFLLKKLLSCLLKVTQLEGDG